MDLVSRVQRLPIGKFHYTLLWVVGLGWMFDAMDTGIIAFIMATLVKDWGLLPSQSGLIVSIGFVGMAIGAVFSGGLADKFGRRTVFAATLVTYSIATALCAFAPNLTWLLVFRFIVGLGLGGQLPVAVTLVSEYVPAHVRGRFIVLLESFWGLGWLVAALVSYFLIPKFGWHAAFLVGGLPALYIFIILKKVPESIPYLINRGRIEEAHALVQKLEKQCGVEVIEKIEVQPVAAQHNISFRQLWSGGFAKRSLMLWLIWFGIVYSYYGIFTWLPSLLVKQGYSIVQSFEYVLIMILAQLPGYVAAAWLVEKLGRKATLAGFIGMCAVSAYFFGQASTVGMIMFWGCLMSFFNLGAWGVLYTYTPEQYPANIRAFGSGWASAIGRLGGIVAPMVVTHMMVMNNGFSHVFIMFTAVLIAVALVILILGEETKGKTLESIGL
ncbi:MFS transporter [Acinetobacter gerneri]|uniref:MFS transporter n=1 Tax=Acinetobacter gerneri TaxID=202952 RepID=A0AAW8JI74_9GAMM|nr:MFS transporter [Acinetobacter gerneri]MDQ9010411.1 MFS transporter [Acinetobacter gerneri]MDQ9014610.1 MFS transporter [Acinetobacter gerneri]MDQ9025781.1 MFS transporter [Acinetobacter gerneri]MDQ9053062.1 MFS transporter [Acinetobacter gerneri]MDQ9060680.1 MFS transporter [Acinetobacter gerneri]